MNTIEMISKRATPKSSSPGVERVEIKVTIRPDQELQAVRALELDQDAAEPRIIFFYDTVHLDLLNHGLVLRARRVGSDADDSTVKIRPVDPAKVPGIWRQKDGFKLEIDLTGARAVCSASFTVQQGPGEINDVAKGRRAIEKLFSAEQELFLREFSGRELDFSKLRALGPIRVLRWKPERPEFVDPVTVEEWRLPDGQDLVEISTKVAAAEVKAARRDFDLHLRRLGLDPMGAQETKTRTTLEFFARQLRRGG
ncbi:MAG TPA: hypothetical protein PLX89_18540 [Verrucomicrobiota bacterium]|nr:hypothetical protein [Verrucomicrobiales bacterium]HRI14997.1 hypothetical protein [Verrucomicrobiota bacterium]